MKSWKKILTGALIFAVIVGGGTAAGKFFGSSGAISVRGAAGGGKESFLADAEVQKILLNKYNIKVTCDPWTDKDMVSGQLAYSEGDERLGKRVMYDFAFFSDQSYYEYYKIPSGASEARRMDIRRSMIALSTPVVIYSWDTVADALIAENIVTKTGEVYYITDMNKLISYISSGKKWSEIGLPQIYGNISIASADPAVSQTGKLYYGLMTGIMNEGEVSSSNIQKTIPKLQNIYTKSAFVHDTPADFFDVYMRIGIGSRPMTAGFEKNIIDFAVSNPEGYAQVKDRIRVLYPAPTTQNSHGIIAFSDEGALLADALNDPEIQKIAFLRYGFRSDINSSSFDVSELGIPGIPQEMTLIIPNLNLSGYNMIIEALEKTSE